MTKINKIWQNHMMNIFFDTEFSKLQMPLDPEPSELISLGCISDTGKRFYAENATTLARPEVMSEWVIDNVIPLLDGGDCVMQYAEIAASLKTYIESFEDEVKMWSDSGFHDWQHIKHLFSTYGWPANLRREPAELRFASSIQATRFWAGVEDAFKTMQPALRRHHALDDAIANRYGFQRATESSFTQPFFYSILIQRYPQLFKISCYFSSGTISRRFWVVFIP